MIPQLLIGRTLAGRYRVDAFVGQGGMGAVFRAEDTTLHRAVAVKVISLPGGMSSEEEGQAKGRFRREAQTAAAIDHPNVVTVFDFGIDPVLGLDYLAMQLLQGEDLASRLKRGALPTAETLEILRGIALGLAAGHERGVVHRDVKPGNVFLCNSGSPLGRVKLVDFGIAQAAISAATITRLTQFGASPRSPAYASPEQEGGARDLTPATDVFSAARTAYAMLLGSPQPDEEQLRRLGSDFPALADLLGRATAPDPADRIQNGGELSTELSRLAVPPQAATHPYNTECSEEKRSIQQLRAVSKPRGLLVAVGGLVVAMLLAGSYLASPIRRVGIADAARGMFSESPPPEVPSTPAADPRIQQIRVWYQATERNAQRLSRVSRGAPDSAVAYLERGGRPLKIVTREGLPGDSVRVTEYYLAGGLPYFVYEHPARSSSSWSSRFYYDSAGNLIRYLRDGKEAGYLPGLTDRAVRTRLAPFHSSFQQGWAGWNRFDPTALRVGHVLSYPGCSESYYLADEIRNANPNRRVLPIFHDDLSGSGPAIRVEGTVHQVLRDPANSNLFRSRDGLTVTLQPSSVRHGEEGSRMDGIMLVTYLNRVARLKVTGGAGC